MKSTAQMFVCFTIRRINSCIHLLFFSNCGNERIISFTLSLDPRFNVFIELF